MFNNDTQWKAFTQRLCHVDTLLEVGMPEYSIDMNPSEEGNIAESLPPGRYFFRWFPYPHLIGKPLEGLRNISNNKFYTLLGKLPQGKVRKFATPFHVLLSMGICPYCRNGRMSYRLLPSCQRRNVIPKWLKPYFDRIPDGGKPPLLLLLQSHGRLPESFYAARNGANELQPAVRLSDGDCFPSIFARQQKCERIVDRWKRFEFIPDMIRLTDDLAIETKLDDHPYAQLIEEEILCYHDELVCQILGENLINRQASRN